MPQQVLFLYMGKISRQTSTLFGRTWEFACSMMSCSVTSPPRSTSSYMAPSKSLTGPKSSSMRRLKGELSHKQWNGLLNLSQKYLPFWSNSGGNNNRKCSLMNICCAFYLCGNILSMLSSPANYTPIVQPFLGASYVP